MRDPIFAGFSSRCQCMKGLRTSVREVHKGEYYITPAKRLVKLTFQTLALLGAKDKMLRRRDTSRNVNV